jgi:CheY-like chemotaxis protein
LVDDDSDFREFLADVLLSAYGGNVFTAGTNEEALSLVRSNAVHLITMDIKRPGGDGVEMLAELREDRSTSHVPIIIVSGVLEDTLLERPWFLQWGIDAAFQKPLHVDHFFRAVSRVLGRGERDAKVRLLRIERETRDLDYKERLDTSNKLGRARLAKDVIAMSNGGGGTILVGIAEPEPGQFARVGIPAQEIPNYETTRLNNAIKKFVGQSVSVAVEFLVEEGLRFALIRVPPARDVPALALSDYQDADLFEGRIYSRTDSAECVQLTDAAEIRRLLKRVQESR